MGGVVKRLQCCVCGSGTKGRQWWNRDTGFGLCENCAIWLVKERGVTPDEMRLCYGENGIHYNINQ